MIAAQERTLITKFAVHSRARRRCARCGTSFQIHGHGKNMAAFGPAHVSNIWDIEGRFPPGRTISVRSLRSGGGQGGKVPSFQASQIASHPRGSPWRRTRRERVQGCQQLRAAEQGTFSRPTSACRVQSKHQAASFCSAGPCSMAGQACHNGHGRRPQHCRIHSGDRCSLPLVIVPFRKGVLQYDWHYALCMVHAAAHSSR